MLPKIHQLLRKFWKESLKPNSNWIFFNEMREIVPTQLAGLKFDPSEDESAPQPSPISEASAFNMTSISQRPPQLNYQAQDPDLTFLVQLLPDIKKFDGKSKSIFKLQTQTLVHNLKYNDFEI